MLICLPFFENFLLVLKFVHCDMYACGWRILELCLAEIKLWVIQLHFTWTKLLVVQKKLYKKILQKCFICWCGCYMNFTGVTSSQGTMGLCNDFLWPTAQNFMGCTAVRLQYDGFCSWFKVQWCSEAVFDSLARKICPITFCTSSNTKILPFLTEKDFLSDGLWTSV